MMVMVSIVCADVLRREVLQAASVFLRSLPAGAQNTDADR